MTRTFQYACEAIEAATHGRHGGYRLALDSMVRALAEGGAGTAEIAEWEDRRPDRLPRRGLKKGVTAAR